jgi:hypothetical protein
MISPSKKVVRVGWSSVRPAREERLETVPSMLNECHPLTLDAKVSAKVGFSHVHMLDFHVDIIYLAIRLLSASKLTSRSQE